MYEGTPLEPASTYQGNTFANVTLGLKYNDLTGTWSADRCVPLVGAGRVIDNISRGIVSVLGSENGLNNIIDLDLTNSAYLSGLDVNLIGKTILSVKDIYRTYAAGQRVGFMLGNKENAILSLDVLSSLVISLYNDGQLVETHLASSDGKTLDLNVLKLSSSGNKGLQSLSIEAEHEFDEVMLGFGGVASASLSTANISIYYAFVGETPIEYITTASDSKVAIYRPNDLNYNTVLINPSKLLDPSKDEDEGILANLIVGGSWRVTVDFGDLDIPKGTELGLLYSQGSLLSLTLLGETEITSFDSEWKEIPDDSYVSSGTLLGISALGGGKGSYSFITTTDQTQGMRVHVASIGVDFGGMTLLNFYKRDPVRLDPTSYFAVAEEVSTDKSYYRFMTPLSAPDGTPYGNVTLAIKDNGGETISADAPAASIQGDRIVGMHRGITYTVSATFTMADGSGSFTSDTRITRYADPQTTTMPIPMTGEDYSIASESRSNSLLSLYNNLDNAFNLVNTSQTDAATYMHALSLIDNSFIVGIETADGHKINTERTQKRVGFVVQPNSELLSLKALDFFRIVLYNGTQKVQTYVPAQNQSVSLGLINGSSGKIRISALTDQEFDRVELQTAGVLQLNLSKLNLYYAFYEETNGDDGSSDGIGDLCVDMLTAASHNLRINYDATTFSSLAMVANSMEELGYILDADKESKAVIPITVNVAGSMNLAVQFDPIATNQWIGVMISQPTGIATIQLLNGMELDVYNNGGLIESVRQKEGLLGLELIGYGDRYYLEAYPTVGAEFDEIRIKIPSLASVADNLLVYGVYMRPDENGNGVPDCAEDTDSGESDMMVANPSSYHICEGDPLTIQVKGGQTNDPYDMTFTPLDATSQTPIVIPRQLLAKNFSFQFTASQLEEYNIGSGRYTLAIWPSDEPVDPDATNYPRAIEVYIHPRQTTWQGDLSDDWNEWTNWSHGVPWNCTDVLIPDGCAIYPVLKRTNAAGTPVINCCRYIQFAANSELVNTQYLNYTKAWVDVVLENGVYNMFSAPLKETYTGDIFLSKYQGQNIPETITDYNWCWLSYTESSYPAGDGARFAPMIYQRMWNRATTNIGPNDGGDVAVNPDDNLWTAPFNLVSERYEAGHGILIRPGDESSASLTSSVIRLPKVHDQYQYYDLQTREYTGRSENITRSSQEIGRFIYENSRGTGEFPLHVLLENKRPSNMYLAGNPFMSHINVGGFFAANVAIDKIKLLVKQGSQYTYEEIARDVNSSRQIKPMQAFLVEVGGIYAQTNRYKLYVHFPAELQESGH